MSRVAFLNWLGNSARNDAIQRPQNRGSQRDRVNVDRGSSSDGVAVVCAEKVAGTCRLL